MSPSVRRAAQVGAGISLQMGLHLGVIEETIT